MRKASFVVSEYYFANRIFEADDPRINIDRRHSPFHALRERLRANGILINTQDLHPVDDSEIVVFFDLPDRLPPRRQGQRFYLLAYESEAIKPENYRPENWPPFSRVFTYRDDLVDGRKLLKINYSFDLRAPDPMPFAERSKLVCVFSANKTSPHPRELYTQRYREIQWLDRHLPEGFDLYGPGWDDPFPNTLIGKVLRKTGLERYLRKNRFATYRGTVVSKGETMRRYKFALCYENIRDVPGYVTEKIWDAFFAGVVPVYLGADNIRDLIPPDCYIDRREFRSCADLVRHLQGIDEGRHRAHLQAVREFLLGPRARPFSIPAFAETISGALLQDLTAS